MKVKELLKKVDPVQIIARAVYSDHERDKIKWILHYYGLYYGILNQPDCPSEYVVLYRAIDEKHPFADTFMRDLNEYRGGKEISSYTCSFMEAALFCNAQVPETLIKHYGKTYIASEILREYSWTCWEKDNAFCPQRYLETILKMLGNPSKYKIVNKYDLNTNLSDSELDDCVMEFLKDEYFN